MCVKILTKSSLKTYSSFLFLLILIWFLGRRLSPASEASKGVANKNERKNPHIPVYGVKEFVCLSVHLLPNSTHIISELAEQNGLKKI